MQQEGFLCWRHLTHPRSWRCCGGSSPPCTAERTPRASPETLLSKHAQRAAQLSSDCFAFQALFLLESYSQGSEIKSSAAIKIKSAFLKEVEIFKDNFPRGRRARSRRGGGGKPCLEPGLTCTSQNLLPRARQHSRACGVVLAQTTSPKSPQASNRQITWRLD